MQGDRQLLLDLSQVNQKQFKQIMEYLSKFPIKYMYIDEWREFQTQKHNDE